MNYKFICNSNFILNILLNEEKNIDILQDLIETLLNIKIKKIKYRKDLVERDIVDSNIGIANVVIVTDEDEEINIGIQIINGFYINYKMILFFARTYLKSTKSITINILDLKYNNKPKSEIKLKLKSGDKEQISIGNMYIIELPSLDKEEINSKVYSWIKYFKDGQIDEKSKKQYPKIAKLDNILNKFWAEEVL